MSILYILHQYKEIRRTNGFLETIRLMAQIFLGIKQQEDEIETLRYFFMKYHNISDLLETDDPELRILQKCDAMLLGIIDKLCRKHDLTYWLDHGSLLGAVRHKGFIPWDDDTDLAMPRVDFNKIVDTLKKEMNSLGITIEYVDNEKLSHICVHYQHEKTGIWCDIFPIDEIQASQSHNQLKNLIKPLLLKYAHYYSVNHLKKISDLWNKKNEIVFNHLDKGEYTYMFHGQEFMLPTIGLFKKEWIAPLKRVFFDGVELNAPLDTDSYLKELYGDGYMNFPKSGVEHHGKGREPLQQWHRKSNLNMTDVLEELTGYYNSIK